MKMSNKRTKKTDLSALAAEVGARLERIYPVAECALDYKGDEWRLFVMARLSAQCTDKRVNEVSEALFAEIPTPKHAAEISQERLEELIRSCGLYRMKAKDLKAMSQQLINDFGGIVPDTVDELLTLSGVGRKIANLIVGDLYGKPAIVTDTHCIRICGRLGFYPETLKDPYKVEKLLVKVIEPNEQSDFCHRIVQFGRDTCSARAPKCEECNLKGICKKYEKDEKKRNTQK